MSKQAHNVLSRSPGVYRVATNVNRIRPFRSAGTARILAAIFLCTTLLLATALVVTWIYVARVKQSYVAAQAAPLAASKADAGPVSPLMMQYHLDLPGRGEIFPSLSGSGPERFPVAVLTIANTSDRPVMQTVTAQVPDWSLLSEQSVVLAAHETRRIDLNLDLLPKAYANAEIRRGSLDVRVTDPESNTAFAQTRRVFLHAAWDLYWGERFSNAQYVARWVTPHDPAVLRLISQARRFVLHGRMPGYEAHRPTAEQQRMARSQANAVFQALRRSGLSYVNSVFTFGDLKGAAQRIRSPEETLTLHSANCIDVSVAFASAMENLGLDPMVIIVPGHAFTGVRLAPNSPQVLYLDLTVLPNGSFAAAQARARAWLAKYPPNQVLTVDIASARALGIYPMPQEPVVATAAE